MTTIVFDRYHVATAVSCLRGEGVHAVHPVNTDRLQPDAAQLAHSLEAMQSMIGGKILSCSAPDSQYMIGAIIERAELHEAGAQNGAVIIIFNEDEREDEARSATLFEPGCDHFAAGPFKITFDSGRIVEVSVDRSCERSETYNECGIDQLATPPSVKLKLVG